MLKNIYVVYHITFFLVLTLPLPASAFPIPVKNHSPIFFGLLFPVFDTAEVLPEGESMIDVQFDYSNIFYIRDRRGWILNFDMELTQLTLAASRGFTGKIEAGLEQPVFYLNGGFLDPFILDYHGSLGFPDYTGQREAPRNRYLFEVIHDGKTWNSPSPNRVTMGDTSFWIKKALFYGENSVFSAKGIIQAPTASTTEGLGNGAWEFAGLLLFRTRFGELELDSDLGMVFPGYIDRGEKYDLKNFRFIRAGGSYPLFKRFFVLMQGSYSTSPFFEKIWYEVTFGAKYITTSGKELTVGILEDLSNTGPDFTFHFSFSF